MKDKKQIEFKAWFKRITLNKTFIEMRIEKNTNKVYLTYHSRKTGKIVKVKPNNKNEIEKMTQQIKTICKKEKLILYSY